MVNIQFINYVKSKFQQKQHRYARADSRTPDCVCLFIMILYIPVNHFSVMSEWVFLGWTSTKQVLMCLAEGHNRVAPVSEAWTRNPSISSQALYHWATALLKLFFMLRKCSKQTFHKSLSANCIFVAGHWFLIHTVNPLYNDTVCSQLSLTLKWICCYKEFWPLRDFNIIFIW